MTSLPRLCWPPLPRVVDGCRGRTESFRPMLAAVEPRTHPMPAQGHEVDTAFQFRSISLPTLFPFCSSPHLAAESAVPIVVLVCNIYLLQVPLLGSPFRQETENLLLCLHPSTPQTHLQLEADYVSLQLTPQHGDR